MLNHDRVRWFSLHDRWRNIASQIALVPWRHLARLRNAAEKHEAVAIVAAWIRDPRERARIASSLRGVAGLRLCSGSEAMLDAIAGGASIALTQIDGEKETDVQQLIRRIARDFPSVVTLLYVSLSARDVHIAAQAIKMGASDIIIRGADDGPAALRNAVARADAVGAATIIARTIDPLVPQELLPFFRLVARHAHRPMSVADAAIALALDRGTLGRRLRRAGLPGAGQIISWHRLLHVGWLLRDKGRPLHDIVQQLDFASAPALDNLMRRYVRLTLSEVRWRGDISFVLEAFVATLCASTSGGARPPWLTRHVMQSTPLVGRHDVAVSRPCRRLDDLPSI